MLCILILSLQVRAAAVHALSSFTGLNAPEKIDSESLLEPEGHGLAQEMEACEKRVAVEVAGLVQDASPWVRREMILMLADWVYQKQELILV